MQKYAIAYVSGTESPKLAHYSRCGLPNAEQRGRIISLDLPAMLCLMQYLLQIKKKTLPAHVQFGVCPEPPVLSCRLFSPQLCRQLSNVLAHPKLKFVGGVTADTEIPSKKQKLKIKRDAEQQLQFAKNHIPHTVCSSVQHQPRHVLECGAIHKNCNKLHHFPKTLPVLHFYSNLY